MDGRDRGPCGDQGQHECGERDKTGPPADQPVAARQEQREGSGGDDGGGGEQALPHGGRGEPGDLLQRAGRGESHEVGGEVAGVFVAEREIPAQGVVRRMLREGGAPLGGGFGPAVLLGQREAEVMASDPIGRRLGDGVAPAGFGGGEIARAIRCAGVASAEGVRRQATGWKFRQPRGAGN